MGQTRKKTLTSAPRPAQREDGWQNLLTGIGDMRRDPRAQSSISSQALTYEGDRQPYRWDDMAGNVVDRPAGDMLRKWGCVRVPGDKETAEAISDEFARLKFPSVLKDAIRWSRAYGGAGILVGVNDGADLRHLADPVDEGAIRSIDYLTVFDVRELQVVRYYNNPLDPNYGEPEMYRLNPYALGSATLGLVEVHASRILRFSQPCASRLDLLGNYGWGDSVLSRMYEVIRDFGMSWSGAAALIADFSVAIYKIRGLKEAIASDRSEDVVARMKLIDLSKSIVRGVLLDSEGEDYERKSTTVTGMPDLLDRFCNRLAAAARMPVTMLMGQAPAGLNATGSADRDFYFDEIEAQQGEFLTPAIQRLALLVCLAKQGPIRTSEIPEGFAFHFEPLRQLSAPEKASVRLSSAQADAIWLMNGVVTPEEVADSRFGGDEFGLDLHLDDEAREAFEGIDPAAEREQTPRLDPGELDPAERPAPVAPPAAGPALAQPAEGAAKVQETALNGAQVQSAQGIVVAVASGELPRDSGVAMLRHFFSLSPESAEEIMGTVGKSFEPKQPEPAPAPGGFPPGKQPPPPPPQGDEPKPKADK